MERRAVAEHSALCSGFADPTRRIIEEHVGLSFLGTLTAHTLLFMLHYWLASRYIGLYIAHENNERHHALIANPAMIISAYQVSRATSALKEAI